MAMRPLGGGFPIPGDGKELQADGEGIGSERFTIDHPCARLEIAHEGAQVQAFIGLPGCVGHDAGAVRADVFSDTFLGALTHVETAEVYCNPQGNSVIQATHDGFHKTPRCLL
jgi:hypothetical protein